MPPSWDLSALSYLNDLMFHRRSLPHRRFHQVWVRSLISAMGLCALVVWICQLVAQADEGALGIPSDWYQHPIDEQAKRLIDQELQLSGDWHKGLQVMEPLSQHAALDKATADNATATHTTPRNTAPRNTTSPSTKTLLNTRRNLHFKDGGDVADSKRGVTVSGHAPFQRQNQFAADTKSPRVQAKSTATAISKPHLELPSQSLMTVDPMTVDPLPESQVGKLPAGWHMASQTDSKTLAEDVLHKTVTPDSSSSSYSLPKQWQTQPQPKIQPTHTLPQLPAADIAASQPHAAQQQPAASIIQMPRNGAFQFPVMRDTATANRVVAAKLPEGFDSMALPTDDERFDVPMFQGPEQNDVTTTIDLPSPERTTIPTPPLSQQHSQHASHFTNGIDGNIIAREADRHQANIDQLPSYAMTPPQVTPPKITISANAPETNRAETNRPETNNTYMGVQPSTTADASVNTPVSDNVNRNVNPNGNVDSLSPDRDIVWWNDLVGQSLLERPDTVTFDMETVLVDTLRHSPLIKGVTYATGSAMERIVQQDAAFDSTVLFSGNGGRTNDPVGNTLTTGGASRLQDETLRAQAGITRNTRRGAQLGLTQELGIKSSNSTFFVPADQGDSRLSLSLTQPLLDRAGQVYNERLVTQARISSRVSWQEMRGDVETRIADVMNAYWRLYESRCHVLQQRELLARGVRIETMLRGRNGFDSSRIELAKAKQRTARRTDQLVVLEAEVTKRQVRLATLIGSDELCGIGLRLELIPQERPIFPDQNWEVRDVLQQAIENRPEIKAATAELESAALAIRVTRSELVPQLNAVINASLASLNGNNRVARSFFDQFSGIGPGFSAGLEYEMPYGRRAARSRVREAQLQYRQRAESLRGTIQQTQLESESALIDVQRSSKQHQTKRNLLLTAIEEETVLMRRWEMMGSDGSRVGVVLENLLDAQQRRTDAEQEFVSAQTQYTVALITMQRAMGTLLRYEGIDAIQSGPSNIDFIRQDSNLPGSVVTSTPITHSSEISMLPNASMYAPMHEVMQEQIGADHQPVDVPTLVDPIAPSEIPAYAKPQAHSRRQSVPQRNPQTQTRVQNQNQSRAPVAEHTHVGVTQRIVPASRFGGTRIPSGAQPNTVRQRVAPNAGPVDGLNADRIGNHFPNNPTMN